MCCTRLAVNTGRKNDAKKSASAHHRTTLSSYIFATKAHIDNRKKKLVKQQCLFQISPQYGELWPTSGWDRSGSLGHHNWFQRVSHLGSVTAWYSSSGRQPNFSALNRGRHLYSAGRPSCWASALAHILVLHFFVVVHLFWLVNVCLCCVRFYFFPYQAKRLA